MIEAQQRLHRFQSDQKPKPLITFVFDEVTVLTLKAEPNSQAKIIPPPGKNVPLLTVEADEMTEFVVKAILTKDLEPQAGKDPFSGKEV